LSDVLPIWMYVLNAHMAFSEMDTLIPLVIVAGNLICMCVYHRMELHVYICHTILPLGSGEYSAGHVWQPGGYLMTYLSALYHVPAHLCPNSLSY